MVWSEVDAGTEVELRVPASAAYTDRSQTVPGGCGNLLRRHELGNRGQRLHLPALGQPRRVDRLVAFTFAGTDIDALEEGKSGLTKAATRWYYPRSETGSTQGGPRVHV